MNSLTLKITANTINNYSTDNRRGFVIKILWKKTWWGKRAHVRERENERETGGEREQLDIEEDERTEEEKNSFTKTYLQLF